MFSHYYLTHMEEFLERTYKEIGINEPKQINIDEISQKLNIWVYFRSIRSRAIEKKPGIYTMIIDSRLEPYQQRLEFLHELGHLLRHDGNQTILPESFIKAQEEDADQFLLYASMPYYIISRLQLPIVRTDAVNYISNIFNVPISLAAKRFDQIQRREFEGHLRASIKKRRENSIVYPTTYLEEGDHSPECSIYAYYDPSGEYDSPSQLIIEINSQKYFTDERIPIDLNERFELIENDNDSALKGIPVLPTDLRLIDGTPNLMLPAIAFRYGKAANRFIVQMKDIESLLDFERSF